MLTTRFVLCSGQERLENGTTTMDPNMNDDKIKSEHAKYLVEHDIKELMSDLYKDLLIHKPANPVDHLLQVLTEKK